MKHSILSLVLALMFRCLAPAADKAGGDAPSPPNNGLEYIDTGFENASPIWYDFSADGAIQIHLLYDHERSSPNRAAGHFHFRIHASPGAKLTIEFKNLDNVWNGKPGSVAREIKVAVVSENGRDWKPIPLESLPENRVRLHIEMPGPRLYVARLEPYRVSDLERLLTAIEKDPRVGIVPIGKTVEGRNSLVSTPIFCQCFGRSFARPGRTAGRRGGEREAWAWRRRQRNAKPQGVWGWRTCRRRHSRCSA